MEARFIRSVWTQEDLYPLNKPEVAFLGKSNVGKSSLINCLLNRRGLAKTSATPGKTRSINFYEVSDFYLVDLPGYGYAKASKDVRAALQRLIFAYLQPRSSLCLVVLLLDVRRGLDQDALRLIERFREGDIDYCVVLTKADKVSKSEMMLKKRQVEQTLKEIPHPPIVFSSKTGMGKDELWSTINLSVRDCIRYI